MYKIINKKKLLATIVLDTIGKIVFYIPNLFSKKHGKIDPENVNSILVIRTAYIGDVVMTLPLLPRLKQRYPVARLSFLTAKSSQPLLENNPHIDEIITYDPFWFYQSSIREWLGFVKNIRQKHFDMIIEARADIRDLALIVFFCKAKYKISYGVGGGEYLLTHVVPYPGSTHKVDYHLNIAKFLECPLRSEEECLIYLSAKEKSKVADLIIDSGIEGEYIVIHPGSRLSLKHWSQKRYSILCDQIIEKYKVAVVFVGNSAEESIVKSIQQNMTNTSTSFAGRVSLRELAVVIDCAEVFIGHDSAPMHLAAAMKTKTLAIIGPSNSSETSPYNVKCEIVEIAVECRASCDENRCLSDDYHQCMKSIRVQDVMTSFDRLIAA